MKDALRFAGVIAGAILVAWMGLLTLALACHALLGLVDRLWPGDPPPPSVMIARADYQQCETIRQGPVTSEKPKNPYRRRSDTA